MLLVFRESIRVVLLGFLPWSIHSLIGYPSTTSYSAEQGFAELGFYPTLDMARTPNTSTNTLPYSTEHGFANQRADLNINQGAGYTTPETSSLSVIIPIITT
jgi:hypothetical protein